MDSEKKVRWSTPLKNYKEINGFMVPTEGEAIWHLPSGDFCYVKVKLVELEFNRM